MWLSADVLVFAVAFSCTLACFTKVEDAVVLVEAYGLVTFLVNPLLVLVGFGVKVVWARRDFGGSHRPVISFK